MKNKVLANLSYIMCAGLGLLNFIFLAIPYVASFMKDASNDFSMNVSGYALMSAWDAGAGGVLSALVQIFVLIFGLMMLGYGICGILKMCGVFDQFPDKIGAVKSKQLAEIALYIFLGLNALLLIFMIILTATNTETVEEYGYSMSAGIRFSAGIFISLIFTIGAIVALKVLEKQFPVEDDTVQVTFLCTKCGKRARRGAKFCHVCGGEVERREHGGEKYQCSVCGKKARYGDNFCIECGGAIERVELPIVREEPKPVEKVAVDASEQAPAPLEEAPVEAEVVDTPAPQEVVEE